MNKEDWQLLYDEINDLYDEFVSKWRRNDFRYQTHRKANDDRVAKIIDITARKILYNKEVNEMFFQDMNENERTYMELTGLWVDSLYYSYASKLMHKIDEKLEDF